MQQETEAETVTWMSYAELGRARGTSAASAKRYANRQRWRKQPGNDGTVRVAVPPGGTVPRETVRGVVPGDGPDLSRLLDDANKRAIAALREQQEHERAAWREDRARLVAEIDGLRAAYDRAEQGRDGERARADTLRDRLNAMQAQLADAHAALQRAETADARADRAEARIQVLEAEIAGALGAVATAAAHADRSEVALSAERQRADELRQRIAKATEAAEQASAQAAGDRGKAEALRQDLDKLRAGRRWARLRAAWHGGE
jgi:chromosome segregation ATPase